MITIGTKVTTPNNQEGTVCRTRIEFGFMVCALIDNNGQLIYNGESTFWDKEQLTIQN